MYSTVRAIEQMPFKSAILEEAISAFWEADPSERELWYDEITTLTASSGHPRPLGFWRQPLDIGAAVAALEEVL